MDWPLSDRYGAQAVPAEVKNGFRPKMPVQGWRSATVRKGMATAEFFNPAGLDLLEDRAGAISYGFIAPRVLYTRVVGAVADELCEGFVQRLEYVLRGAMPCACFSDLSALGRYDGQACSRFLRFVTEQRVKVASLAVLTWSEGVSRAARAFAATIGEPVAILTDPVEFERLLSNVAPAPRRAAKQWQDAFPHEPPSAFR